MKERLALPPGVTRPVFGPQAHHEPAFSLPFAPLAAGPRRTSDVLGVPDMRLQPEGVRQSEGFKLQSDVHT